MPPVQGAVTRLLEELRDGSSVAFERLLPLVYGQLRLIARRELRRQSGNVTLQPTELLHEAYLKLARQSSPAWQTRAHFYGVAAPAMRQVLVDYARRRRTAKRGGNGHRLTLNSERIRFEARLEDLIALDEALDRLGGLNERLQRVVELRFFGGLEEGEIAGLLGISLRSVERDWAKARLFLHQQLYPDLSHHAGR